MKDVLRQRLNRQIISPLSYFFAQFIAQKSGEKLNSTLCVTAALVSECNQQGDICIHLNNYADTLVFNAAAIDKEPLLDIKLPSIKQLISELTRHHCVSSNFELQPLILDGHYLYLGKLWHYEHYIVSQIKQRLQQKPTINNELLKEGLNELFATQLVSNNATNKIALSEEEKVIDWQKIAASIVVSRSFSVISGGPGTGKTTTLIKILALLLKQNPMINIQLCAPTGKAAIRMLEAINSRKNELNLDDCIIANMPQHAKTIHRLLAYKQGQFSYNLDNQLTLDCLVIDEASMIDFEMMYHLMRALPEHCKVILLGDKDQLSSVDAGHVFSDICGRKQSLCYSPQNADFIAQLNDINVNQVPSSANSPPIAQSIALLKTSFRFNQDSGIGRLAKYVNAGNGKEAIALLKQKGDELNFFDIEENNIPSHVIELVLTNYEQVVAAENVETAVKVFSQFQVLCAIRKGAFGVSALNELINQRLYLRHKVDSINHFNGQPIIITQNDYENNLFNGDIGMLWQSDNHLLAYFQQLDGTLKSYPLISLNQYETAWAITVHKSQGSEYDSVLMVLPNLENNSMIKRELIYTGITRAKKTFNLCAISNQFIQGCKLKTERSSGLAKKLGWDSAN